MNVLVTGGAGYIGSHTIIELLNADNEVTVVDNLSNSKEIALQRVQELSGKKITFHKVDLLDKSSLENVFKEQSFDAVIHFAALKAVGESVRLPIRYYHNNVTGTLILIETMEKYHCKNLVFSSSATVYGAPSKMPITEDFPLMWIGIVLLALWDCGSMDRHSHISPLVPLGCPWLSPLWCVRSSSAILA